MKSQDPLNHSYAQQFMTSSSLMRTVTVEDETKSAESLRSLQIKNTLIRAQFCLIALLLLAVALLHFKIRRMCATDPPVLCRLDL